jgi:hypothetical protein
MKKMKWLLLFSGVIFLLSACSKSDDFLGSDPLLNSLKNGQDESIAGSKYEPGQ